MHMKAERGSGYRAAPRIKEDHYPDSLEKQNQFRAPEAFQAGGKIRQAAWPLSEYESRRDGIEDSDHAHDLIRGNAPFTAKVGPQRFRKGAPPLSLVTDYSKANNYTSHKESVHKHLS